jgi:hypothetical protein
MVIRDSPRSRDGSAAAGLDGQGRNFAARTPRVTYGLRAITPHAGKVWFPVSHLLLAGSIRSSTGDPFPSSAPSSSAGPMAFFTDSRPRPAARLLRLPRISRVPAVCHRGPGSGKRAANAVGDQRRRERRSPLPGGRTRGHKARLVLYRSAADVAEADCLVRRVARRPGTARGHALLAYIPQG